MGPPLARRTIEGGCHAVGAAGEGGSLALQILGDIKTWTSSKYTECQLDVAGSCIFSKGVIDTRTQNMLVRF